MCVNEHLHGPRSTRNLTVVDVVSICDMLKQFSIGLCQTKQDFGSGIFNHGKALVCTNKTRIDPCLFAFIRDFNN